MRSRPASWVAEVTGGRVIGDPGRMVGPDVVIDTRAITADALFVALPGERVDGHDFTGVAAEAGAAAVLVTRETATSATQVVVDDGIAALTRLGHAVVESARAQGPLQVVAITGSSGKTSTKDVLAQLLERGGATVSPEGSFNNEIGVPLTATRVDAGTRYLVSEMGARGPGHIAWLCDIVGPDVSMVLNVGSAHLGEFGSVEAIARAKGEIVEPLPADGWAVLNADDPRVAAMAARTSARLAWFGLDETRVPAGALVVTARDLVPDDLQKFAFTLVISRPVPEREDGEQRPAREEFRVQLPLIGRHHVPNALAAAAAALALGVPSEAVAHTLGALQHRSRWRMELVERADGAAVINDSYNANPDSMGAALETLSRVGAARRAARPGARVLAVLGDMLELGDQAVALHREVGRRAAEAGVDELLAVGEHAADLVAGAAAEGVRARAVGVDEASSLHLASDDVVLVKASRGLALERVVQGLLEGGHDRPRPAQEPPA